MVSRTEKSRHKNFVMCVLPMPLKLRFKPRKAGLNTQLLECWHHSFEIYILEEITLLCFKILNLRRNSRDIISNNTFQNILLVNIYSQFYLNLVQYLQLKKHIFKVDLKISLERYNKSENENKSLITKTLKGHLVRQEFFCGFCQPWASSQPASGSHFEQELPIYTDIPYHCPFSYLYLS